MYHISNAKLVKRCDKSSKKSGGTQPVFEYFNLLIP
jgi:hypothetical protein